MVVDTFVKVIITNLLFMKWWWFNFTHPPLKVEVPFASTSSCDDTFACLWNWHPQQHMHSHHHKQTMQWVQFQPHSLVGFKLLHECAQHLWWRVAMNFCNKTLPLQSSNIFVWLVNNEPLFFTNANLHCNVQLTNKL